MNNNQSISEIRIEPASHATLTDHGESERLLTTADICTWLQIAEPTLRTWVRNGLFPKPMKLGQLSRWSKPIIEDYLSDKQASAEANAAARHAETGCAV